VLYSKLAYAEVGTILAACLIGWALTFHANAQPFDGAPPGAPVHSEVPTPDSANVDPELLRLLTPLEQFAPSALSPSSTPPPQTPTVKYRLEVKGLDVAGLKARFLGLSSLKNSKTKAVSTVQIAARAQEDVKTAESLMRSEGYYDGRADLAITPAADASGEIGVLIAATLGVQYRLGTVAVSGPTTQPPGLPRKSLPLQAGEFIVAPGIEAAEANVSLRLPEAGYPFVKLGQRDVVLDVEKHTGDYTLPVDPGKRSTFGHVLVEGAPVLSQRHIRVIPRFKAGQLYDSRKVDDMRRALVATSLYSSVGVTNHDTGTTAADGTEVVDLQVQGTPAKPRTLSAAVGYDTGLGASVSAAWTDHNLFPDEGALTVQGLTGTQQQQLGVSFVRSNAGLRDLSLQGLVQYSHDNLSAYTANTATLGFTLSRNSTPIWQKVWTYSAGVQAIVSSETGYDLNVLESVRRTYEVGVLPLLLEYDRSDSLLNPTRGFRLIVRPSPAVSFGDGTQPFMKGIVEGTGYYPVATSFVLATRLQFTGLYGASAMDIAPSQRVYAGGGGSVRGYGYQELGPKDPSNNPIGGASSTEFSVEGRYRFGNLGLVGFLDGGQVYQSASPSFSDIRYGVGVGARFYTNFGPLRFDIATPIARQPGESVVSVYISIGQAF
jgi:translocation and assembly module TamA